MGKLFKPTHITCPDCGEDVSVPLYWQLGIEGRMRCDSCNRRFRIGYKAGALLAGIGWTIGYGVLQAAAYILSVQIVVFVFFLFIPLSMWLTYKFRITYLKYVSSRRVASEDSIPEDGEQQ